MDVLTFEQLKERAAARAANQFVELPDLKCRLPIRPLTPSQVLSVLPSLQDAEPLTRMAGIREVVCCGCEVFATPDDVEASGLTFGAIVDVFDAICKLSGIDGREVKERAKNSEA